MSDRQSWIARLIRVEGDSIPGEAVDINGDILVVEFPREGGPTINMAEQVVLKLEGGGNLTFNVRAISRTEGLETIQYQFQMIDRVRPDLPAVFHGRRFFRIHPPVDHPVHVTVWGDSTEEIEGTTHDISRGGISVVLTQEGDASLCGCEQVRLRFELPGEDGPLEFAGRIRRRALKGSAILHGIEFVENGTADFEQQANRVSHYVLALQVERLKRTRKDRDAG